MNNDSSPRHRFRAAFRSALAHPVLLVAIVGGAAGAVALAAVLLATGGGDTSPAIPDATTAGPGTASPPGAPPPAAREITPCPVDREICDFALTAEAAVRAGDAARLIAPGTAWANEQGRKSLAESIRTVLPEVAWPRRLASIGCPVADGAPSCKDAFSLTFTTLRGGERSSGMTGILTLGFQRLPGTIALTAVAIPLGPDRVSAVVGGAQSTGCELSGAVPKTAGECVLTAFFILSVIDRAPAAAGAPPCPVLADICDFAAAVEKQLRGRDYAAIAGASAMEAALREGAPRLLGPAPPRLVSIGCPFGAVAASCQPSFSLVFTTLEPEGDWTAAGGLLILRYDRKTPTPTLAGVDGITDRDIRRAALTGGLGVNACNLSGVAPDESAYRNGEPCSRTVFSPYWTERPFVAPDLQPIAAFTLETPAPPPPGSVLYIATGCWGCEGHDTGLVVVATSSAGATTVDSLPPPTLQAGEVLTGYAATPDGSLLIAGVCRAANCGPLGQSSRDARSRVLGSRDGGFTWQELARYDGYAYPQVAADGRILVSRTTGGADPDTWTATWDTIPAGPAIARPAGADLNAWPVLIPGGVAWLNAAGNALIRDGGSTFMRLPLVAADYAGAIMVLADGRVLRTWYRQLAPLSGATGHYIALHRADGAQAWLKQIPADAQFSIGLPLSASLAIGNVQDPNPNGYGQLPALVDLDGATIRPISGPFGQPPLVGRNRFLAYRTGPFAKVTGAGDCLNVRAEASATGKVLGCFKDGVLLGDLRTIAESAGVNWLKVTTPAGEHGWASVEYLAR